MTFDRLLYIDRLKDAGIDEPVARAHAEALREALLETVATKADLKDTATSLKADLKDAVTSLKADLKEVETSLRAELKDTATSLRADLKDAVQTLDRKIEIASRDLIIKGAGGLIVIASLIVGLKLFG
jgi:predicted nuclease with TOPRIM domain